jgi:hypothetical protein
MWLRRNRAPNTPPQVAPAADHTRAILSPLESVNIRPPAPKPEPTRQDPPAARQTAPMSTEPALKSARRERPTGRRPSPVPAAIEQGSHTTKPAVDSAAAAEAAPAAALPPTPPPAAPAPPAPQPGQTTRDNAPPLPPTTPATAASPAPKAVDPAPAIRRVVADYAAAIESRSLPDLQRVYPGMTSAQQQGWNQFFQTVRDVKARLSVTQLNASGSSADAQVAGTYDYLNTSTGRAERQPVSFRASFKNDSSRWRISQVR